MKATCTKTATLPAVVFAAIAFAIGLALLAIQVILWLELIANGLQYLCADGGPEFCFVCAAQATAVSQAPLVFFMTFVFLPAFLALLNARILKALPPAAARWGVLAMWFTVACYASVSLLSLYFSAAFSALTSDTGWVLYPPLSGTPLPAHLAGTPNALQINALAIAVLLTSVFISFALLTWRQQHSRISCVARTAGVAFICVTIWTMITNLGRLITMVSLDRNFGTAYFDPAAKAQKTIPTQIIQYLATPQSGVRSLS